MDVKKLMLENFRPAQRGLKKVFGKLEASIMEYIWKFDSATVRDVYESLCKDRKIAYTTVMTVMSRLSEKGYLEKLKEGNAYIYKPKVSSEDFNESVLTSVISGLGEHLTANSLAHFVNVISTDNKLLDQLEKLIAEKRAQNGSKY